MKTSNRDSNFELLRIISMIFIVTHHIFVHCINIQVTNIDMYESSKAFLLYHVIKRLAICEVASAIGPVGNTIFILLSGYFLIDKKINISNQILKLLTQMFFSTTILVIISFIYNLFNPITKAINFSFFNIGYWFVGYYIFTIFIAWLIINKYIKEIKKELYISILFILFAFVCIGYLQTILNTFNFSNIIAGIFFYLLGGYIKMYDPFKFIKPYVIIVLLLLILLCLGLNYYQNNSNIINNAILNNQNRYTISITTYGQNSILGIFISVLIFEFFKRFHIKTSILINFIASSTFTIYLIHENVFFYYIIDKIKWNELIINNQYGYLILYLFIIIATVFIIGISIYSLYLLMRKLFINYPRITHEI